MALWLFPVDPYQKAPHKSIRHKPGTHPGPCGHYHAQPDPPLDTFPPDARVGLWLRPSGLLVLDYDRRHGAPEPPDDPSLHIVRTPNGWHLYYSLDPDLRPATQPLPPGVELKREGYVLCPPSPGYTALDSNPPPPYPAAGPEEKRDRPKPADPATIKWLHQLLFQAAKVQANRNTTFYNLACAMPPTPENIEHLRYLGETLRVPGWKATLRSALRYWGCDERALEAACGDGAFGEGQVSKPARLAVRKGQNHQALGAYEKA